MTTITASLVKELRDKTGAGMMDCKTALTETKGDMEEAVDWLRKKGLSKAAKKAGRVAAEGLIGVTAKDKTGAIVEVNSETDFVARNEQFQDMVRKHHLAGAEGRGRPRQAAGHDLSRASSVSVEDLRQGDGRHHRREHERAPHGGRCRWATASSPTTCTTRRPTGLGKIGVLVALESKGDKAALATLGRQLAMHIAAASPAAVSADELDPALIERERAVYTEQAKASGKPAEIVAKMVEGRLRKEFYQQVVLLQQTFLGAGGDGKATVEQVLKGAEKTAGAPIKVAKFVRYALGEGIDKKDGDFAAEVAAAAGKR